MNIPSHELQAFRAVAETLHFSEAASRIHITQPALSQRIQSLERTLGLTLFVRDRKGVKLTEAGSRLLRYCQVKDHLESELLSDLGDPRDGKLGGHLRLAGYSSVMHSVLVPALADLLRENPAVRFSFSIHEMGQLMGLLERGEADFIVMDHVVQRASIRTSILGHECYVFVQSSRHKPQEIYLDNDPDDRFTENFLRANGREDGPLSRCFMDDMEGILTGISLGLGQGVIPRHLLSKRLPIKVVSRYKPLEVPVVLHHFQQPYYSKLQNAVIQSLQENCTGFLK